MRGDELNMLNGIKKGVVKSVRNIAVPQCAYSTVIQLRNWLPDAVGGVVWFSMDNPGQSPRVPGHLGITDFLLCIKSAVTTAIATMPPYGTIAAWLWLPQFAT